MSDKTSQRVESSKRQWSRMWSHVLAAILIIAASVIANFSYERVSERPQLVFGVLVIFAGIVAALTLIVAKVRERDAPARRLKDSVRTAYSSALSLTGNQLVEGGQMPDPTPNVSQIVSNARQQPSGINPRPFTTSAFSLLQETVDEFIGDLMDSPSASPNDANLRLSLPTPGRRHIPCRQQGAAVV